MAHRLDPLLRPKSIAVVGASPRANSVGYTTLANLKKGGFAGALYAVNPRYDDVMGVPCFASVSALPQRVEHAVFAIADERIEDALAEAIASGVKAVTLMSTLVIADDTMPALKERIERRLKEGGVLACGGNCMGFYNFRDRVWVCGFATRDHQGPGTVALISQSGSGMCGIVDVEGRIDFSFAASTGQELTVTQADYLDFALDLAGTRAVGLFIETIRDVPAMRRALAKANAMSVPVVAVKVGRTKLSARMAFSHTGAIAGSDAAYDALFDRYGVARAADLDELATSLIMFAQPRPLGPGGLVSMHDSGGIRQLVVDLADTCGVPLPQLQPSTMRELDGTLDPGLTAMNPLDSWSSGGADFPQRAAGYMTALMRDEGAALGAVIQDRMADSQICPDYLAYLRTAQAASQKPAFLVSSRQGSGADPVAVAATRAGIPVLDGTEIFLRGVRHLFDYRDFRARAIGEPAPSPAELVTPWRARLQQRRDWDEAAAAALIGDFGVPTLPYAMASSMSETLAVAERIGYPVVLKALGVAHKSDVGGVALNLRSPDELRAAYGDLARRLGTRVAIVPMELGPGVEMMLGLVHDAQFGPLVMLGFGGIYAETLHDAVFLVPPFDQTTALRRLDALKLRTLLDAQRGRKAVDRHAFAAAAERFSVLACTLGDEISELDVNPILVKEHGCVALDALVIPRIGAAGKERGRP